MQHWLVLHRISDLRAAGDEGTRQQRLAEGLLADASTTIVYRQHAQEIPLTTDALGLSQTERQLIGSLDQGVALWRAGGRSFEVRHLLSDLEWDLIDTDQAMGPRRDQPRTGAPGVNRNGDDHVWPLVALCAALAAVLSFAIIASALAGLLGRAAPIWIGPSEAGTLLARLVSHLSDPALAWPAADRRELPDAGELQAVLLISLIDRGGRRRARLAAGEPPARRGAAQAVGEMGDAVRPRRAARPPPRARAGSRSATTAAR